MKGVPWILALAAAWLVALGFGFSAMLSYESTPGERAEAPAAWPTESRIERTPGQASLVMLVHPLCPCSRASIAELATLMNRLHGKLTAHVLFMRPDREATAWKDSETWASATKIPGVVPLPDTGGAEAALFGARTSGQTVLYDSGGRLIFSGGLTPGRGHVGENVGSARVLSLVEVGAADRAESSTYGCPLLDPQGS